MDYMALHIECRFNKNPLLQCYFLAFLPAGLFHSSVYQKAKYGKYSGNTETELKLKIKEIKPKTQANEYNFEEQLKKNKFEFRSSSALKPIAQQFFYSQSNCRKEAPFLSAALFARVENGRKGTNIRGDERDADLERFPY